MKPRRLHRATTLSIVTTSLLVEDCSMVIACGWYSSVAWRAWGRHPGRTALAPHGVSCTYKETALDISRHMCLHTLCSLADKMAEGTVLRPKVTSKLRA